MKARVKATGNIVDVEWRYLTNLNGFNSIRYVDQKTGISYFEDELDFYIEGKFAENCLNGIKQDIIYNPDYWTRLEHQYAGMAMQGLMSYVEQITPKEDRSFCDEIVDISFTVAHSLVEKYKKEEK